MGNKMKVIVVGAGIIGSCVAFQLSRQGAEVIVVDGGTPAATSTSFGWINANHPSWLHPLLVTGILGGFTTFSSFALDTQLLLQNHAYLLAGLYAIGSLLLGITLCLIGYLLTS